MSETQDPAYEGEILKASSPGAEQITPGLDVVSIDGEHVGKVKELRDGEFLIDRPRARDLWVPFSAVVEAAEQGGAFRRGPAMSIQVVLFASAEDIEKQGWRHG